MINLTASAALGVQCSESQQELQSHPTAVERAGISLDLSCSP
jgi:hypothetical protein